MKGMDRRLFLKSAVAAGIVVPDLAVADTNRPLIRKQLPDKSASVSAIGMGTWMTFDVPPGNYLRDQRTSVLETFFELGGEMVDSSPMYGQAEDMLGYALKRTDDNGQLFSASKIWTPFAIHGREQMGDTEKLWGVKPMDLMYVHNLLGWEKHLPQLREWQQDKRIRYTGLTTSHGRRHSELESLLKTEAFDFVQLTLNIDNIQAEKRLLPLAADHGVAVVVNRPFSRGALISKYARRPLPGIAREMGCQHWSQFLLLYTISHPAVTCAIPATTRVDHMQENMATLRLELPDESVRAEMRSALL